MAAQPLTRKFSDYSLVLERANEGRARSMQALKWISMVLDEPNLPQDAWAALGDGVQLCRLITALYPDQNLIKHYNPANSRRLLLLDNINIFLEACKNKVVGFNPSELFVANDLLNGNNTNRVVDVVERLALMAAKRGFLIKWSDAAPPKPKPQEESKASADAIASGGRGDSSTQVSELKAKSAQDLEATRKKALSKFEGAANAAPVPTPAEEKPAEPKAPAVTVTTEATKTADPAGEPGDTPIITAVRSRKLLQVLRETNPTADELNKSNARKRTPLHVACEAGDLDAVEILVGAGASVNVSDDQDKTPLHYAVQSNNTALVSFLIEKGAEVNKPDRKKNTPLHIAARRGQNFSTMRLVAAGARLDAVNDKNEAPIQMAAEGDHRGVIELLVDSGANVNISRSTDGWSPLYTACYQGVTDTVELLKGKADAGVANAKGWTCLHAAAEQGHLAVVKLLVESYKVKLDVTNSQGVTPLYCACDAKKVDVVEYLLGKKADPNLGKPNGWKPIHAAVRHCSLDLVKKLAEANANLDAANEEVKGYTPLMIAVARGATGYPVAELLLSSGANKNGVAENGNSALHLAAYWNFLDHTKLLVSKGADMTIKNKRGHTALDQAAKFGYAEIVNFLADAMKVEKPKLSKKNVKQAKRADAVLPEAAPTPESLSK